MSDLLKEFVLKARIAYYELALQHIDPCHADVPEIVMTLSSLYDKIDDLFNQPGVHNEGN